MGTALITMERERRVVRGGGAWRLGTLCILAFLSMASMAFAQRSGRHYPPVWETRTGGDLVEVQVLVDGRATTLYDAPNHRDRHYFEAFRGRPYAIRIQNRSGERIGVLLAVDGLNVVNGERTSLRSNEPMYVLEAWGSATIRGWRTSLSQVREFVFVDEARSYANRTDQANGDMGWIRVLAFREQQAVAWHRYSTDPRAENRAGERELGKSLPSKPGAQDRSQSLEGSSSEGSPSEGSSSEAPEASAKLGDRDSRQLDQSFPGTGWGNRRRDRVRRVEFNPVRVASDHIVLRYEYASGLVALGIFPDRDRLRDRDRGELTFARPPRR